MANRNWLSRAAARSQVDTATAGGTWVAGDTVTATINGKTITFTATLTTPAHMATGLLALLQASMIPEFREITWTSPTGTTIAGTSAAGVPFTLAVDKTTAGTGTFTSTTTVAATGPNHWSDANNWMGDAVPVDGDDVNIDLSLGSILYGLDQSAVTLASLYAFTSVGGTGNTIGLPKRNESGYTEYREDYLKISATLHRFDTDSGRIKIDFGSAATAGDVLRTGSSPDQGIPAILLRGTSTSNAFEFVSGSGGIAIYDDEASAGATLKVNTAASVLCGVGCSIPAVVSTGQLDFRGTCATTFTINGGTTIKRGTTNTATVTVEGGEIDYRSSGGITTQLYLGGRANGTLRKGNDLSPVTFASTTLRKGGTLDDPHNTITLTAVVRDSSVGSLTAA